MTLRFRFRGFLRLALVAPFAEFGAARLTVQKAEKQYKVSEVSWCHLYNKNNKLRKDAFRTL